MQPMDSASRATTPSLPGRLQVAWGLTRLTQALARRHPNRLQVDVGCA